MAQGLEEARPVHRPCLAIPKFISVVMYSRSIIVRSPEYITLRGDVQVQRTRIHTHVSTSPLVWNFRPPSSLTRRAVGLAASLAASLAATAAHVATAVVAFLSPQVGAPAPAHAFVAQSEVGSDGWPAGKGEMGITIEFYNFITQRMVGG